MIISPFGEYFLILLVVHRIRHRNLGEIPYLGRQLLVFSTGKPTGVSRCSLLVGRASHLQELDGKRKDNSNDLERFGPRIA